MKLKRCIACKKVNYQKKSHWLFFSVPKDDERRTIWFERINRFDLLHLPYKNVRSASVCSNHFDTDQFQTPERLRLNRNGVPRDFSLDPGFLDDDDEEKVERRKVKKRKTQESSTTPSHKIFLGSLEFDSEEVVTPTQRTMEDSVPCEKADNRLDSALTLEHSSDDILSTAWQATLDDSEVTDFENKSILRDILTMPTSSDVKIDHVNTETCHTNLSLDKLDSQNINLKEKYRMLLLENKNLKSLNNSWEEKYDKLLFETKILTQTVDINEQKAKRKICLLEKQIGNMRANHWRTKHYKKTLVNKRMKYMLRNVFTDNQLNVLFKNDKEVNWTDKELCSAFKLRYFSEKAYHYMRDCQNYPLPSPEVLKKWSSAHNLHTLEEIPDEDNNVNYVNADHSYNIRLRDEFYDKKWAQEMKSCKRKFEAAFSAHERSERKSVFVNQNLADDAENRDRNDEVIEEIVFTE